MRDDCLRLEDILEAIDRIQKYAARGRDAFEQDELVQTWILHHLRILGEASRTLSPSFKAQYPEVPWSQPVGMRNILVHHYFAIDLEIVWLVVERDLPPLKRAIEDILRTPERGQDS